MSSPTACQSADRARASASCGVRERLYSFKVLPKSNRRARPSKKEGRANRSVLHGVRSRFANRVLLAWLRYEIGKFCNACRCWTPEYAIFFLPRLSVCLLARADMRPPPLPCVDALIVSCCCEIGESDLTPHPSLHPTCHRHRLLRSTAWVEWRVAYMARFSTRHGSREYPGVYDVPTCPER